MREESTRRNDAIVRLPAEGERLNVLGVLVRVLADSAATGGACVVMELTVPPGEGPPLHRHTLDDECFFITEGTVLFELNGRRVVQGPGGFVRAPRGSIHTFRNAGASPARMVVICTPGGLEGPFREVDALSRDGNPTPETVTEVFARFDLEILGPPLQG